MNNDFSQCLYYKGEKDCPFKDAINSFWWGFERGYIENPPAGLCVIDYVKTWIRDKAAPNSGYTNLDESDNPWLNAYYSKDLREEEGQ